jgi:hypothetical protein
MRKPNEIDKFVKNWSSQYFPKPVETGIKADIYYKGIRVLNAPVMDYEGKK